jgi:pimeloyl-ACP methyl ester carboxylesterase
MSAIILSDRGYNGFELIGHKNPYGRYPNSVIPVGLSNEGSLVAYIAGDREMVSFDDELDFIKHDVEANSKLKYFDFINERLFALDEHRILVYSLDEKEEFFTSLLNNLEFSIPNPLLRLTLAQDTQNDSLVIRETISSLLVLIQEVSNNYAIQWYEHQLNILASRGIDLPKTFNFVTVDGNSGRMDWVDYLSRLWKLGDRFRFDKREMIQRIVEIITMHELFKEHNNDGFLPHVAKFLSQTGDAGEIEQYLDSSNSYIYDNLQSSRLHEDRAAYIEEQLSQVREAAKLTDYKKTETLFCQTWEEKFTQKQRERGTSYIVHYEALGRGKPVILLHSWVGSSRYWIETMQALSKSYRVYALDLWGFGDSARNPNNYSIDQQARLLSRFIDEMGFGKVAIVGHGLGALVGFRFAFRFPESVNRVIAISPPLEFDMVNSRLWTSSPMEFSEWLESQTPLPIVGLSDTSKVDFQAISASRIGLQSTNFYSQFSQRNIPCLLVFGQQDEIIRMPTEATSHPLTTQQVIVEESGHFPMIDNRIIFDRLVRSFLASEFGINPGGLQQSNVRDVGA